jgi:uncharacterized repeat protein (TIGR03803 family)
MTTQEKCRQGRVARIFSKPGILIPRIFLQFAIGSLALAVVCMVWTHGGRANAEIDDSASIAASSFSVLYSFGGEDGASPYGSLTLSGRTLYGMTVYGGNNDQGTIFQFDTKTRCLEVLHSFGGLDGAYPTKNSLVLSGTTLYGMTFVEAPTMRARFLGSTRKAAHSGSCTASHRGMQTTGLTLSISREKSFTG